jgi:hypothetical protein
MKYILSLIIASSLLLLGAPSSFAYVTTGQQALSVNQTLGIYTIDFRLGHEKHEIYVPIRLLKGDAKETDHVSYEIYNDDNEVAQGMSYGIVLGNVPVKDGMYVVPKGKAGSFTILMFYAPLKGSSTPYYAHITSLPFNFDGSQDLQLNPSELTYYTTKSLTLHP